MPQYCYHPGLSIPASCRICLVEVEGIPKLVPSCQTPMRDGMVVYSKSSKAIANQKQVMEYLLINHPLDCPVCDQAGECFLQDYSYNMAEASRGLRKTRSRIRRRMSATISISTPTAASCAPAACGSRARCRAPASCTSMAAGTRKRSTFSPASRCNNKLAGNVVDLCPVGALLDKDFLFKQRVWLLKQAPSISPADSGGENIYLEYNEGVVYRIKPRYNAEVNQLVDQRRHALFLQGHPR